MSSRRCAREPALPAACGTAGAGDLGLWLHRSAGVAAAGDAAHRVLQKLSGPRYRDPASGIPAGWRTLTRDSQADPAWAAVYRAFDIISPWVVGRFRDSTGIEHFYADSVAGPARPVSSASSMPVVFPGFSWHNMNHPLRSTRSRGAAAGSSGSRSIARSHGRRHALWRDVRRG